jgi:hypothetical protein
MSRSRLGLGLSKSRPRLGLEPRMSRSRLGLEKNVSVSFLSRDRSLQNSFKSADQSQNETNTLACFFSQSHEVMIWQAFLYLQTDRSDHTTEHAHNFIDAPP